MTSDEKTEEVLFNINIMMFGTLRIGEATNPGPGEEGFIIGCMNPSGLMGKGELINMLPGTQAAWCVSETHLTALGTNKFKEQLRYTAAHYKL